MKKRNKGSTTSAPVKIQASIALDKGTSHNPPCHQSIQVIIANTLTTLILMSAFCALLICLWAVDPSLFLAECFARYLEPVLLVASVRLRI